MNWKLIFQLSLFGLAMGIATVFVPFFWLAIFIMCAYIIVRQVLSRHFVHGPMVSIVNRPVRRAPCARGGDDAIDATLRFAKNHDEADGAGYRRGLGCGAGFVALAACKLVKRPPAPA